MRQMLFLLALLLLPTVAAGTNDSIFDVLDMEVFNGDWSVVNGSEIDQVRCNFPGQWYLITGVVVRHDGGDLRVKTYGVKWNGCRSHKDHSDIGSSTIYNHSDWCEKVYYPYVVTEGVWNAQPQYAKDVLNNTTKFMGVVPDPWYYWHPYLGRPDDMPINEVSQTKHIFGWLTIEFENASIINGTMYVADKCSVVPVYDVWNTVDGIKRYERCEDCESCEDMYARLISVEVCETVIEDGNTVHATVGVVLKWGYFCWNCWPMNQPCRAMWLNTTETATFTATAKKPTIMNQTEIDCTAYITFYNNSRSPVAFIDMETLESVIKTIYTYNNTSITKYNKVGWPRDDHVEFTNTTIWDITRNQSVVTRRGESVVIKDRDFNISLLNITVETPYARHPIDDFRLTIVEPPKTHPLLLAKILAVIGTSVMGVIMMVGVLRRSF